MFQKTNLKGTWAVLLPTQLAWGLGETTCQAVFTWQPYRVGPRPLDEWLKGGWSHHGGGQNTHWRDVGLSYRHLAKCRIFFPKTVDRLAVEDADVLIVDHKNIHFLYTLSLQWPWNFRPGLKKKIATFFIKEDLFGFYTRCEDPQTLEKNHSLSSY